MGTPKILICPDDRGRATNQFTFKNLASNSLSYFFNLSASVSHPADLAFGDRNLVINGLRAPSTTIVTIRTRDRLTWDKDMHKHRGNVSFIDGRVDHLKPTIALPNQRASQPTTNLLVFP
jgi:prepilin-type processing-associated H-X9-DG protein